jgi:hypothetical protein
LVSSTRGIRGNHISEGIHVEEAVLKGKKVLQRETGLTQAFFKRFSVVYDERIYRKINVRKAFPVTVKFL